MMEIALFEWLNAGGNLALFALVYIMWKFDRRLVVLETIMKNLLEKSAKNGKLSRDT